MRKEKEPEQEQEKPDDKAIRDAMERAGIIPFKNAPYRPWPTAKERIEGLDRFDRNGREM